MMDVFKPMSDMINRLRNLVLFAMLLSGYTIQAQQDPQYTQYLYNMNLINPAYAGSYEAMSVNFLGRAQWLGIEGSPRSIMVNLHTPIAKRLGLGVSVIADKIGPLNEQLATVDFSYTIPVSETANLAFGLKGGISFANASLQFLNTVNGNDDAFANQLNRVLPNVGAGFYYYAKRFYVGASVPNLLQTLHFDRNDGQITNASDKLHYFFTTGYVFDLTRTIKFKPGTLVKAVSGAPLSIDFSGNFLFHERFEIGVNYRLDESVSALFNVRATDNLRIGYAYDYTLTNLGDFNSGSHEIFVLFDFNFIRDNIKSPRFF